MLIEKPDGTIEIGCSGCCCPPGERRRGQHTNSTTNWWRTITKAGVGYWKRFSHLSLTIRLARESKSCGEFVSRVED